MPENYDVAIVGGGPSGAIAAMTLAAAGSRVFLAEKDFSRVKACGGATPSRTFDEFKLSEKNITRKIKNVSVVSPSGDRVEASFSNGYLAMVERGEFDGYLRMLAAEAGADLAEAEFLRIKDKTGRIRITVLEKGKERDISSDFLIAADGINSRISKILGLETLPGAYTIQEAVQDAEYLSGSDSCEFWFGSSHSPKFYSWIFPKKGYIDIGTASYNGKALKELLEKFKARCGIRSSGRQRVYRVPTGWRDSLIAGNVLFTGDAAGFVMPLSYEGIYYAMKSGMMAAEAIIKGSPEHYEKHWNKKFRLQFRLMKRIEKFFLSNDRTVEQMMNLYKNKRLQKILVRLFLEKDLNLSSFLSCSWYFRKIPN